MNHLEAILSTKDGIEFHYESWEKSTGSYGKIGILFNGIGEYCGVNQKLINFLVENGFKVFSLDLPGFGKTSLQKSQDSSLQSCMNCFHAFIENIQATAGKSKKIIIFANDISTMLILAYLSNIGKTITKCVFFAPLVEFKKKYFPAASILDYCLLFMNIKKYKTIQLTPGLYSDQEKFQEIYQKDKQYYKKIPLQFFIDCINFTNELETKRKILNKTDLLYIYGDDDILSDNFNLHNIFSKLHFSSIKMHKLLRTRHNIFYGKYSDKIYTILTEWFSANNI